MSPELTKALATLADWKQPPDCACDDCKDMCRSPCMPTPAEAQSIMDYAPECGLSADVWIVQGRGDIWALLPAAVGKEDRIGMASRGQPCSMQNKDGLRTLHAAGLKPIEGRLAHHSDTVTVGDPSDTLRDAVLRTWDTPEGRDVVQRCRDERGFEVTNY